MTAENPGNAASISMTEKALVVAAHICAAGEKPAEGLAQKTTTAVIAVAKYLKEAGY